MLKASKDYLGEEIRHQRKDNFVEFARGIVSFSVDGRGYAADIIVGTTKSGAAVLYDLVNIQNKKIVADASYATQNRRSDATTTSNSISDSSKKVKTESEKNQKNALFGDDLQRVAWYDGENTIYLNAGAGRVDSFSALLGHEVFHKMFKSKRVKGLFMQVFNRLDEGRRQEVIKDYKEHLEAIGKKDIDAELDEEVAAAYAQELFKTPDVWDFILEGEPSLSDRILAFFGGVPKRYSFAKGMDAAAKRWLNHYKQLFNEVAELNRGEAAIENAAINYSYDAEGVDPDALTSINEEKMQVSEGRASLDTDKAVVTIIPNPELEQRIANSSRSKYDVIKQYLIEMYHGHTFELSDGRRAIMDNSDAQKLSNKANKVRTAQLGNLREIVEKAKYDHSAYGVEHSKFTDFHYYAVTARYGNAEFDLWINVGTAKNDGVDHIYSITNKKEDAPTNYGVGGPVGYHLQNASSDIIIPDSDPKSNSFDKNSSKNAEPHPPQAVTLPQQGRQGGRSALAHDRKANASDVKSLKAKIVETGIDPKGIVELAASISCKKQAKRQSCFALPFMI